MKIDNTKDYYKILGVSENATEKEIKKAYRKLSLELHPDKQDTEEKRKEAEAKFAEINEANDILSDPQKKQQYDQLRQFGGGFNPFGFDPFGGFGGFNVNINRPKQNIYPVGADVNIRLHLSIEDLYNYDKPKIVAYNKQVRCKDCGGKGGTDVETCPHCNGTGTIRQVKQQGPMTMVSEYPCNYCNGTGEKIKNACETCHGTGLVTEIAEIDFTKLVPREYLTQNNVTINIPNEGSESRSSEMSNGALHIMMSYAFNTTEYEIKPNGDIVQSISIPYYECILGNEHYSFLSCNKEYHEINIPECTQDGTIIKCDELHGIKENSSYLIRIKINIPKELSEEVKSKLIEIKNLSQESK